MTQRADMNAAATWSHRRNGLRAEPAAKWAMQLAVLSSLGAVAAWALILVSGDPRRSLTFWGLALVFGIWGAPVQAYARWTMLSLWFSLLLWPLVALAALIANHAMGDAGAAPLLMAGVLAYTVLMSAAALVALRRSSLPFGTAKAGLYPDGYRAPGELPPVDPQLRSTQVWFSFPLIATIMICSGVFAGVAVLEQVSDAGGLGAGLAPMLVVCFAEPALLGWGQYQGRRTPARKPPAFVALAVLQSVIALGGAVVFFVLAVVHDSAGAAAAGMVVAVIACIVVACDLTAWRRMKERADYYGGR